MHPVSSDTPVSRPTFETLISRLFRDVGLCERWVLCLSLATAWRRGGEGSQVSAKNPPRRPLQPCVTGPSGAWVHRKQTHTTNSTPARTKRPLVAAIGVAAVGITVAAAPTAAADSSGPNGYPCAGQPHVHPIVAGSRR
jgi:hypothetical protein